MDIGFVEEVKAWPAAAVKEVDKAASEDGACFSTAKDDGVAATFGIWIVDWTSERVRVFGLWSNAGDGIIEDDRAEVEDCRSFGGLPARLNNLKEVTAGCTATALPPFEFPL